MIDEMNVKVLKALSDPTRLRIVMFLAERCCGVAAIDEQGGVYDGPSASEICCHICGVEKITSTVSHHLHELEGAGVIRIERQGKRMVCSLRPETLDALAEQFRSLAKGGNVRACA